MNYDPRDLQIFVCAVVGRAMGSGKFDAAAIGTLTQCALETFLHDIAPKLAQAAPPPSPAPGASQGPQRASPTPTTDWQGGAASMGAPVAPETAPFNVWGGQPARFGKKDGMFLGKPSRDVAWYELTDAAIDGNRDAKRALEIMANSDPAKWDQKYAKQNLDQKRKAMHCMQLVAQGKRTTARIPEEAELPGDEPPF